MPPIAEITAPLADRYDRELQQSLDYDPLGLMPGELPPHPRNLVTPKHVARTRQLMESTTWARAALERLIQVADEPRDLPDPLPAAPDPSLNRQAVHAAHRNALAHVLTGQMRFHERALDLMRRLAAAGEHWPVGETPRPDDWAFGGGLTESAHIRTLADTYDLLASEPLEPADDARFRAMLAAAGEAANHCNHYACGNHGTNALLARLAVASALNDRQGLHDAIYGCESPGGWRYGIAHQLRHDYLADGLHWERTPGYHFYTLYMVTDIAWIMRNLGVDLFHHPVPSLMCNDGHDLHRGYGPEGMRTLKAAYDAPLYEVFADLDLSLLHDSGLENLTKVWIWSSLYEIAYDAYQDPRYAWLLHRIETAHPPDHPDRTYPDLPMSLQPVQGEYNFCRIGHAVLAGELPGEPSGAGGVAVAELRDTTAPRSLEDRGVAPLHHSHPSGIFPPGAFSLVDDATIGLAGRHERGCTLFPAKGEAILRSQAADAHAPAAYLFYGPHSAGHQSPAALHVDLHAQARRITDAPRSGGYEDDLHLLWTNTTIAHNTVTRDQRSMFPFDQESDSIWEADSWREAVSDGQLELFQPDSAVKAARASNENVYPGTRLDRTLLVTNRYILDAFRVLGEAEHTYDWAMHVIGAPDMPEDAQATELGGRRGYAKLRNVRRFRSPDPLPVFAWRHQGRTTCVQLALPEGAQMFLADPPATHRHTWSKAPDLYEERSALVVRTQAKAVLFLALWWFPEAGQAQAVSMTPLASEPADDVTVRVEAVGQAETWTLPFAPEPVRREEA